MLNEIKGKIQTFKSNIEDKDFYAISLVSPLGQALVRKRVGDVVFFQGKEMRLIIFHNMINKH